MKIDCNNYANQLIHSFCKIGIGIKNVTIRIFKEKTLLVFIKFYLRSLILILLVGIYLKLISLFIFNTYC